MKPFFSKAIFLLLCFAASITACKQRNSTLQPASYINPTSAEIEIDPIARLSSFSDYDLIYFLITSNGASVYVSER